MGGSKMNSDEGAASPDGYETHPFMSVGELLTSGQCSIGDLATAVEADGVWGWDRYGRYMRFPPASPEAAIVLDALAAEYQSTRVDRPASMSPLDSDDGDGPYSAYGWPRAEAPQGSQQLRRPAPERRADRQKADRAKWRLIGALREIVLGECEALKDTKFSSQTELAQAIASEWRDKSGLSERTIQEQFAKGRDVLKEEG